jgi:CBS domain-containing protein
MKVREIMTAPAVTCTEMTSLNVAAHLMEEADYGTLPVVDTHGQLVGIITDRDICLALSHTNRNAMNTAVHEVMTTKVVSALLDDDLRSALTTMTRARVRRLPVRDAAGRLHGILSVEDVIVRGLETGGIDANAIIAALRTMYVRVPAAAESNEVEHGFMPG